MFSSSSKSNQKHSTNKIGESVVFRLQHFQAFDGKIQISFNQIILSIVSWFLTSVINKFKHLPFPPLRRHPLQHLFPYKRFLRIRGHKSAKLLIETLKWHTSKKLQTRIQNSILFQDLFKKIIIMWEYIFGSMW